jgi:hypothetical protein
MDTSSIALGITNTAVAVLTILLSVPLVLRRVGMNSWYGVRFKKSFESEENWYKINEYGGRQLILWSIVLGGIGGGTLFVPLEGRVLLVMLLACAPLILLIPAVTTWRWAKKL